MEKAILKKWLKAGFIYQHVWNETDAGTPQGGIISPVIMNLALDGLEKRLRERFSHPDTLRKRNLVNFIRYADDFIITARTKELLEEEIKPFVAHFLKERGLELSQNKSKITHISDGFDFLGNHIRKFGNKLIIKPSTKNVKAILAKIREFIKGNLHTPVEELISKLNPIIKGWANYHRHTVSKKTFANVDNEIFLSLKRWAKRRHPDKSWTWVMEKYFKPITSRTWRFQTASSKEERPPILLVKARDVVIKRHVKIKSEANPYDPDWEIYFEQRLGLKMLDSLRERKRLLRLWFTQEGICPNCSQKITKDTGWNIHHILKRANGGKDTLDNLVLLHPNCHQQIHSLDIPISKPRSSRRALRDA